jgi:hypothetical protein
MTKKRKLTVNQEKAISAIIQAGTIEGAAGKVGLSRTTLYTYLKDESFKQRLDEERKLVFDEATGLIKTASKQAAATLVNLLGHRDPGVRRLTATNILNFAIKGVELHDLEERLDRIEAKLVNGGRRF